ncbi:MAG TPA: dethiobiotin synthase [Kiritimatiellia bacterium]|nr:dethiobiotin synthase [Kiritimatiellia bacterium]HMO97898.1 dethiobiotin synthase [Kiritimatiellia bacterium]HMP95582.1 dethiobiotin synthase [Kiritimatiellia bacterium]
MNYFIAGTDTGVGKTVVTAALFLAFAERGLRVFPFKPVQTGWRPDEHDLRWALEFAPGKVSDTIRERLNIYRFSLPASPHLAAAQAGVVVDPQVILKRLHELESCADIILLESAGGVMTPLTESWTMLDLLQATAATPILVARSALGMLNHTALAWEAMTRAGCPPAALVINDAAEVVSDEDRLIRNDNIAWWRRRLAPIPVVVFDHQAAWSASTLRAMGSRLVEALTVGSPRKTTR